MKKVIAFLFCLSLIAANVKAQNNFVPDCKAACINSFNPDEIGVGVDPFRVDTGVVRFFDPQANYKCGWTNVTYPDYEIKVFRNGTLFVDEKHFKCHSGAEEGCLPNTYNQGGFIYWFRLDPAPSDYTILLCKNCKDGSQACAAAKTFSTKPVVPSAPTGTNLNGGKTRPIKK